MTDSFNRDYWEAHWQRAGERGEQRDVEPNPYISRETATLTPGTALDAGCGEAAEALWLAAHGWRVTAADISAEALRRAEERATRSGVPPGSIQWTQADLTTWEPLQRFDLVTTHYAHPTIPQLAFYERISRWVSPGGTLLIVGHLHSDNPAAHNHDHAHHHHHNHHHEHHGHQAHPPQEASATAASITAGLDASLWNVVTAQETSRNATHRGGKTVQLHDVVVRATRRGNVNG